MKNLLQMIQKVKVQNGVLFYSLSSKQLRPTIPQNDFMDMIKQCVPFVSHSPPHPLLLNEEEFNKENESLDLPFKVCSFENLNENFEYFYKDLKIVCSCILVVESGPREYLTIGHFQNKEIGDDFVILDNILFKIIQKKLKSLYAKDTIVGTESIRQKIKLGTGKDKEFHTIRKIVHIRHRDTLKNEIEETAHRNIEWSHRFRVRGHWRKINGLGKDRNGDYCVAYNTWVTDFVKGSEDLPIISKTYMESKQFAGATL